MKQLITKTLTEKGGDFGKIVTLGAGVATMIATWDKLQAASKWMSGMAVVNVELDGPLEAAVRFYLREFSKTEHRSGIRKFTSAFKTVHILHRVQLIAWEVLSTGGNIFWHKGVPIFYKRKQNKEGYEAGSCLFFFRGTVDIERLLHDAVDFYNAKYSKNIKNYQRHYIRYIFGTSRKKNDNSASGSPASIDWNEQRSESPTNTDSYMNNKVLGWDAMDLMPPRHETSITDLALTDEAENLIADMDHWIDSERWYVDHRVPWRMGVLLHGAPGNGKTALIRGIAQRLDLPVFVFDLSSMSNQEFQSEWSMMMSAAPCMALLEDIDGVFNGRQNVANPRNGITFDSFLNTLDGIQRCDGLMLAVTTNDISKLDPALGVPDSTIASADEGQISTRPGRIDRTLEMTNPDEMGRRKIVMRILDEYPECWSELIVKGENDTGAQFQERCAQLALLRHKQKHIDQVLAEAFPE